MIETHKKLQIIFNDLDPLKGSSCHAFFIAKGLDTDLLDGYSKAIKHSRKSLSPEFIYHDIHGNPLVARSITNQDTPLSNADSPAYFYCREIGPPCLIDKVYLFKEPIELLSYLQIQYPISNRTLCLAVHPLSPITEISDLPNHFKNARFVSFIPNTNKADILLNLKLSLALAGKDHRLNIHKDTLQLTIEGKTYNYHLSKIEKNIIPFVKKKKQQPLLFKSPPKKYQSFNSMINDHRY